MFVTNQPCHLELDRAEFPRVCLCIGFKIPDFGHDLEFPSFIAAHRARQKYTDAYGIFDAFANYRIPITFDGELPAFAFGNAERRFVIGERYEIAKGLMATLTTATVVEPEGESCILRSTRTTAKHHSHGGVERRRTGCIQGHPHTFFGKIVRPPGRSNTPMELFDFFVYGCKNTPRERLPDACERP